MTRPKRFRLIEKEPEFNYFKPQGVGLDELKEVILSVEEYESLRLKDYLELSQEKSAMKMGISQPTFHRLVLSARKKVSSALVEGKSIKIEGGDFIKQKIT